MGAVCHLGSYGVALGMGPRVEAGLWCLASSRRLVGTWSGRSCLKPSLCSTQLSSLLTHTSYLYLPKKSNKLNNRNVPNFTRDSLTHKHHTHFYRTVCYTCYIVYACVCECVPQVNGKKGENKNEQKKSLSLKQCFSHSIPVKTPDKPMNFNMLAQTAYIYTSVCVAIVTYL